jgi:hypothetical protein
MAATGQHLRAAASAQEAFFEAAMYALDVQGWPSDRVYPRQPLSDPVTAPEGADCVFGKSPRRTDGASRH